MAKIVRNIEDVSKIEKRHFVIEIEELELIDDNGNSISVKIDSISPVSANTCFVLDNTVDWNHGNFHFLITPVLVKKEDK